jgi:hypothetical protein
MSSWLKHTLKISLSLIVISERSSSWLQRSLLYPYFCKERHFRAWKTLTGSEKSTETESWLDPLQVLSRELIQWMSMVCRYMQSNAMEKRVWKCSVRDSKVVVRTIHVRVGEGWIDHRTNEFFMTLAKKQ